ncbi:helix-turn-helix transcriptional regulator [Amycolatopsis antarctica]|uniref:Helix-turn-helix transcriptional regulator n=1 Tax=Amycolatopsis antarctica TaxID=1854586 RepID=A0A263CZK7_9PSEU|nr:response regulator transcription factor [Amycolatopsis antarctica]OZM70837.1 helix-turn-helix transcriptional regulator [Amycolatopsis antarctica]
METSTVKPGPWPTTVGNGAEVAVAVHSSDPMTGVGAASILRGDDRLKIVTGADVATADVAVVVEESIGEGAFAFLREIRATAGDSPPRCVIVTDHFRVDVLMTAIECGMAAMLQRCTTGGDELVRTILAVSDGAAFLPPRLQGSLLTQLDRMRREVLEPNGLTLSGMSARERDVLRYLADGHGTEEIAGMLAYSESTVKNVLYGLMNRYGLNTRAHAVAFALRAGVI